MPGRTTDATRGTPAGAAEAGASSDPMLSGFDGPDLIVGVDAGGTRTRAVLATLAGEVLGIGQGGPANSRTGPFEPAAVAIRTAVRQALGGLEGKRVRAVCIGSAGLEHPGSEADGRRLLGNALDPDVVLLDTDAYIAWAGAHAAGAGIVVIAGTGSICLGVDAHGRRVRVGGWGPRFGDEGSAYAIASSGIRRALEALDGRSDDGAFLEALRSFDGLRAAQPRITAQGGQRPDHEGQKETQNGASGDTHVEALALTGWLYHPHRSASDVARFAPFVDVLAAEGNARAQAILASAGRDLAALVHAAAQQLRDGEGRGNAGGNSVGSGVEGLGAVISVALGGGVLRHSERVRQAFDTDLAQVGGYRTLDTAAPPVIGALITALQAAAVARRGRGGLSYGRNSVEATTDTATARAIARLRASGGAVEAALDGLAASEAVVERNTDGTP